MFARVGARVGLDPSLMASPTSEDKAPPVVAEAQPGITQPAVAAPAVAQPAVVAQPAGVGPQQVATAQMANVVIPAGVSPGQQFTVLVNGQNMLVTAPSGAVPGQTIQIKIQGVPQLQVQCPPPAMRAQPVQTANVVIPAGVSPGQQFMVMVNGQNLLVTAPSGAVPGQTIQVQFQGAPIPMGAGLAHEVNAVTQQAMGVWNRVWYGPGYG